MARPDETSSMETTELMEVFNALDSERQDLVMKIVQTDFPAINTVQQALEIAKTHFREAVEKVRPMTNKEVLAASSYGDIRQLLAA